MRDRCCSGLKRLRPPLARLYRRTRQVEPPDEDRDRQDVPPRRNLRQNGPRLRSASLYHQARSSLLSPAQAPSPPWRSRLPRRKSLRQAPMTVNVQCSAKCDEVSVNRRQRRSRIAELVDHLRQGAPERRSIAKCVHVIHDGAKPRPVGAYNTDVNAGGINKTEHEQPRHRGVPLRSADPFRGRHWFLSAEDDRGTGEVFSQPWVKWHIRRRIRHGSNMKP